ncbi:unnamed protein product [Vicia faba]|uniref:Uncharacterized protein n=1 Tax=Vicia faba TaxID=3906 RepID=A0AAV1AZ35_VICFA|nr:unnamed protein product [Vicia faba]
MTVTKLNLEFFSRIIVHIPFKTVSLSTFIYSLPNRLPRCRRSSRIYVDLTYSSSLRLLDLLHFLCSTSLLSYTLLRAFEKTSLRVFGLTVILMRKFKMHQFNWHQLKAIKVTFRELDIASLTGVELGFYKKL